MATLIRYRTSTSYLSMLPQVSPAVRQVTNSGLSNIMRTERATYINKMLSRVGLMDRLTKQHQECDGDGGDHDWSEDGSRDDEELEFHLPTINLIPEPNL